MAHSYEVGIHLIAKDGISGVLANIAKTMFGLHADVGKLTKAFKQLQPAILGAVGVAAGLKLSEGMVHAIEKGNEMVRVQRNMAAAGVSLNEVHDAYNKSWAMTAKYQNISAVESMKMINDARSIFGNQEVAIHDIEPFIRSASFLKSYEGGKHADDAGLLKEIFAAMKSGEIAGKISPEDMSKHVNMLTAMKVTYGEQTKIADYLKGQRTGGVSLRNTDDRFRYGMFPAMIQEFNAGAGTMLQTAYNKIVAGTGNKTDALQAMDKMGLLEHDMVKYDKVGRAIGLSDPRAIKNNSLAAENMPAWVMHDFVPALNRITQGTTGKEKDILESQYVSKVYPDRNAAKTVLAFIQQHAKLEKDADLIFKAFAALNADQDKYNAGSLDYQLSSFTTQWNNLMTALGAPSVGNATSGMRMINGEFSEWSKWLKQHPVKAEYIGGGLTVLGAGIAALGVAVIGTAIIGALGVGGWFVVGLAAIVATILAFRKNFQGDNNMTKALANPGSTPTPGIGSGKSPEEVFRKFTEDMNAATERTTAAIKGMWGRLSAAISEFFSGIASAISNGVKALSGALARPGNAPGIGSGATPGAPTVPHVGGIGHSWLQPGPSGAPSSKLASNEVTIHNYTHLDGREVARTVTKHQVAQATFPTSVGRMDTHGTWAGPAVPAFG